MNIFEDTFLPIGLRDSWFASDPCPSCSTRLRPVTSFDETHYLCDACGKCWRVRHGSLWAVDPLGCHGCAAKGKHECLEVLRIGFPRFGSDVVQDDAT